MARVFSNGGRDNFVLGLLQKQMTRSQGCQLAAPYFNYSAPISEAADAGKPVHLLVCLNTITNPVELAKIVQKPGVSIRYYTSRLHAKIFVFDAAAIVGSANLTSSGLQANREAVVLFDAEDHRDVIDEVKVLFLELWNGASVLTPTVLARFRKAWDAAKEKKTDLDGLIEDEVGRSVPPNIDTASRKTSSERIFLEAIRRDVYERYRPAFSEVGTVLSEGNLRRNELGELGLAHEVNRFLNWVRLVQAPGDEAWRAAPIRNASEREDLIQQLGVQWKAASDVRVTEDYQKRLREVIEVFGRPEELHNASQEHLTKGLLGLHAFSEQLRFVRGGHSELPKYFWSQNPDVDKVRRSLEHLLFGLDDFVVRLHDILYDKRLQIGHFGFFSALELFGTVRPDVAPPVNGRIAKGLRFLGFEVKAN